MKVGDLVRVKDCGEARDFGKTWGCECFFCTGRSNRIGVVLGPAPRNGWNIMFDCGSWVVTERDRTRGDVEVISESR